jgi:DNA-binding MarR family transcriptional regulator
MAEPRADLAAMIAPLLRRLVALEQPILDKHGLAMWGYSVLVALGAEPVRTQAALAAAIGADKTRIIGVLDTLQQDGLIERVPDPADRRARLVSLTTEGRALRDAVQTEIRQQEDVLLTQLHPRDREGFLRGLRTLS